MSHTQHRYIGAHEREWQVDLDAAARVAPWARRAPALLEGEVAAMAEHFPHWLLALGRDGAPALCGACGETVVFAAGAARCVACDTPAETSAGAQLMWVGHLPTLVRPEPALEARLPSLAGAGFPTFAAGAARYLLVMLTLAYPDEWPHEEPAVRYSPRFLDLIGVGAGPSGATHMLSGGRACLYAYAQYQGAGVAAVLQQRAVNHLASLIKIAGGTPPAEAFIGRIH
ncbi:MAG: hypothetical protein HGA45_35315 [Chloroflexales bacterium]|nr:hypothetical protein [Chloroflexales bacterium]